MRTFPLVAVSLLTGVISGCSGHQPAGMKMTGTEIVATTVDAFERQANRLCPYGYDLLGEARVFVEGESNSRLIRCRHQNPQGR